MRDEPAEKETAVREELAEKETVVRAFTFRRSFGLLRLIATVPVWSLSQTSKGAKPATAVRRASGGRGLGSATAAE